MFKPFNFVPNCSICEKQKPRTALIARPYSYILLFNEQKSTQTAQAWGGVIFLALFASECFLGSLERLVPWAVEQKTKNQGEYSSWFYCEEN